MYFNMKNYLKNNYNYIAKYSRYDDDQDSTIKPIKEPQTKIKKKSKVIKKPVPHGTYKEIIYHLPSFPFLSIETSQGSSGMKNN